MRPRAEALAAPVVLGLIVGGTAVMPSGQTRPDYPIQPASFTHVHVSDSFWAPRIETNRAVTIPFIWKKNEETGRIDNFAVAGKLAAGQFRGQRYNDTDVFKTIEGTAYSLRVHPDPALDEYLDEVIRKIGAAQERDGYLFTARTIDPAHPQPGIGDTRYSNEPVSHELYNSGHLYEAAVAHFEATGKRTLLEIAIRNADLVGRTFGPERQKGYPGHQGIEMGLVRLYRVTGDARYLELAAYFINQRGPDVPLFQYPPGSRFAVYNDPVQIQAHKPVLEQEEAVGHAVRAVYMYSGIADVAALMKNARLLAAVTRLWDNVVSKKIYLTGGVGAKHDGESFGANYELPNASAYNETCAAIGNVFWNHRMFLLSGDARYLDVLERTLYNGLIAGVSLDGKAFFYTNPLQSDGQFKFNQGSTVRAPFFDVACCPGNICRFLPSVPGYVYATGGDRVYVNLFIGGESDLEVAGRRVRIRQETRYPWDGTVKLVLQPAARSAFEVNIRIPGWARDEPLPGGLYRFAGADSHSAASILVNGGQVRVDLERGFARLRRTWSAGDQIELRLPMPVRRVFAHASVTDDTGKVALVRGPIVYAVEGIDNGGHLPDFALTDNANLDSEWRPDLLNGVVVIHGRVGTRQFTAIPYYAWANRGAGEMAVWLKREPK